MSHPYVKLSYKPAGAKRKRSVWAKLVKQGAKVVVYAHVDKEGNAIWDGGMKGDARVSQSRIIVLPVSGDWKAVPARMNLYYGWMEVVS